MRSVHLHKVAAGAGDGQVEEVEADAPAATLCNGERVRPAGRRQVCLGPLTRRAGAHLLLHRRRQAGPPHRAARQGQRLVAAEVPAQRSGTQLMQHLRLKRAGHAKSVAARAESDTLARPTRRLARESPQVAVP